MATQECIPQKSEILNPQLWTDCNLSGQSCTHLPSLLLVESGQKA